MNAVTQLRMERQFLTRQANKEEYILLYRDTQPGQNVYWCGFGCPPSITFRASFDDVEFNRQRLSERELVKGRFQGGTLGWVENGEMELFACMCKKNADILRPADLMLLDLIRREGPMNIQQMKELTGMLVKEITPPLHRLQEAFCVYEDQYDGEWDREWYLFSEMFPNVNLERYTRSEALQIVLRRFAYRHVWFDLNMAKSFYRLPVKDIKAAIAALLQEQVLTEFENGYILSEDADLIRQRKPNIEKSIFVMHRSDFLVKSNEHMLKARYQRDGSDVLQYILIDGEFHGAVFGHFKYGPYVIDEIAVDLPEDEKTLRWKEITDAVDLVNPRG